VRSDIKWYRVQQENLHKSEIKAIKEHLNLLDSSLITVQEKLTRFLPSPMNVYGIAPLPYMASKVVESARPPAALQLRAPLIKSMSTVTPTESAVNSDKNDDDIIVHEHKTPEAQNGKLYAKTNFDNLIPSRVTDRDIHQRSTRSVNHWGRNGTRFIGKNVNFEKKSTRPPRLQKQCELVSRDNQTSKYIHNEYADDDSDGFQRYVKKEPNATLSVGSRRLLPMRS